MMARRRWIEAQGCFGDVRDKDKDRVVCVKRQAKGAGLFVT